MHSSLKQFAYHKKETFAVALVGPPNSGKTTLFNWLTGSKFKTVNYPGATVEYSVGLSQQRYGEQFQIMDTPGTYSLEARSPDEEITKAAVFHHKSFGASPLIISVVDGTQLRRHLLMTEQLIHSGFRVVMALTMSDLLKSNGHEIDIKELEKEYGVPVIEINGKLGGGVDKLVEQVRSELRDLQSVQTPLLSWTSEQTEAALKRASSVYDRVLQVTPQQKKNLEAEFTRNVDRILLHPFFGLIIFFGAMGALFTSIFWLAKPFMQAVGDAFAWGGEKVVALAPGALWTGFISDGLFASFGSVLTFVPQIFILFVGIVALEDSGYLARAATLIDRPFSKIGLNGRSFVPLLSAYACAVPAMMAARTINSKRERWITLFIIPLLSCSARLPVYSLLLSFLFRKEDAWKAGLCLSGLYIGSLTVGAIAAMIVNYFVKADGQSLFMLELPIYRRPRLRNILRSSITRTYSYIKRAGPAIFTFALIIWALTTFPNYHLENKSERLNTSYASQAGKFIEPVFRPMGGDWRTGVSLMCAFAAREVFVSSLAVVLGVTESEKSIAAQESLLDKMREAKTGDGTPLFTFASVFGLIIFFMIALQCLSTSAMAAREAGGIQFAVMQLLIFNIVAYVLAVSLVQGLRAIGIA